MAQTLKVFLLAGQSNMVGSDAHAERIDDYPRYIGAGAPQPDVRFTALREDGADGFPGWRPLQPRDAFGPEITFARLLKQRDRSPIALVKSAIGGTTAAYDWNPDAPASGQRLYPRTLALLRGALADLTRAGIRHRLEAVLWHQGENDMLDRRINGRYAENLAAIIDRFRADLEAPDLLWFLGEASEKGIWGMDNRANLAILRAQQQKVLDADRRTRWVPTSHLAFEVMGGGQPHYHFGTQGQLQLGEAFGTAYLREIGKAPSPKPPRVRRWPARGAVVRLFVLAGQRTAEGEDAFVAQLPRGADTTRGDVLFRYSLGGGAIRSRGWEPLGPVDPLGNFGPELSLGAGLREALPASEGVAIVKFTHSGAQIPDWSPGGSPEARRDLYPSLIAFVRAAVDDLKRRGYTVEVASIFWHVGENDTWFSPYRRGYTLRLRSLAERVRTDLGAPSLLWVVSEAHPRAPWGHAAEINAEVRALAQEDRRFRTVTTEGLDHGRVHFGARGTLQLGDAYARAWRSATF